MTTMPKEYTKEYRAKNRDKILAQKKEYYYKNKEKLLLARKEYCANNKEKIAAGQTNWRKNNKDKIKVYNKKQNDKKRLIREGAWYAKQKDDWNNTLIELGYGDLCND